MDFGLGAWNLGFSGLEVCVLEFRVASFGFRALGFGIPDSGLRGSGFGSKGTGFRGQVQNSCSRFLEYPVSGLGFQIPGFRFRVSGFGFRVSGFGFRLSGCRYRWFASVGPCHGRRDSGGAGGARSVGARRAKYSVRENVNLRMCGCPLKNTLPGWVVNISQLGAKKREGPHQLGDTK